MKSENIDHLMKTRGKFLVFCALLMIPIGVSNIWGIFQPYVMDYMGWNSDTASATYMICVIMFVVGGIIGGKLQDYFSPKIIILLGGVLMGIGTAGAAFSPSAAPVVFYILYGVICGIGYGISYNQAVSLSQKWFYDKRGFSGGIVVAALGISAMIATPVSNALFVNLGFRFTFIFWGVLFAVLNLVISFLLKILPRILLHPQNRHRIYLFSK